MSQRPRRQVDNGFGVSNFQVRVKDIVENNRRRRLKNTFEKFTTCMQKSIMVKRPGGDAEEPEQSTSESSLPPIFDFICDPILETFDCPYKTKLVKEDFVVGKLLGRGAYGYVIEAKAPYQHVDPMFSQGEDIVFKVMRKGRSCRQVIRNDLLSLEALRNHRFVPKLRDVFEDERYVYLAMERINGPTIRSSIHQFRFSERQVLAIVAHVLDVLSFMHREGMAHMDLKLDNLMFVHPVQSGEPIPDVRVIDFGLSIQTTPGTVYTKHWNQQRGTPQYAAPELKKTCSTGYADMWSVGVILYRLISRKYPVKGMTFHQVARNARRHPVRLDGREFEGVSDRTKALVKACLDLDADKRPTAEQAYREAALIACWLRDRDELSRRGGTFLVVQK